MFWKWEKHPEDLYFTVHQADVKKKFSDEFELSWARGDHAGSTFKKVPDANGILSFEREFYCPCTMYLNKKDDVVRPKNIKFVLKRYTSVTENKIYGKLTIDVAPFFKKHEPVHVKFEMESGHSTPPELSLTFTFKASNREVGGQQPNDQDMSFIGDTPERKVNLDEWDKTDMIDPATKEVMAVNHGESQLSSFQRPVDKKKKHGKDKHKKNHKSKHHSHDDTEEKKEKKEKHKKHSSKKSESADKEAADAAPVEDSKASQVEENIKEDVKDKSSDSSDHEEKEIEQQKEPAKVEEDKKEEAAEEEKPQEEKKEDIKEAAEEEPKEEVKESKQEEKVVEEDKKSDDEEKQFDSEPAIEEAKPEPVEEKQAEEVPEEKHENEEQENDEQENEEPTKKKKKGGKKGGRFGKFMQKKKAFEEDQESDSEEAQPIKPEPTPEPKKPEPKSEPKKVEEPKAEPKKEEQKPKKEEQKPKLEGKDAEFIDLINETLLATWSDYKFKSYLDRNNKVPVPPAALPFCAVALHCNIFANQVLLDEYINLLPQAPLNIRLSHQQKFYTFLVLSGFASRYQKEYAAENKEQVDANCNKFIQAVDSLVDESMTNFLKPLLPSFEVILNRLTTARFNSEMLMADFATVMRNSRTTIQSEHTAAVHRVACRRLVSMIDARVYWKIMSNPNRFSFTNGAAWSSFCTALEGECGVALPLSSQLSHLLMMSAQVAEDANLRAEICPDISASEALYVIERVLPDDMMPLRADSEKFAQQVGLKTGQMSEEVRSPEKADIASLYDGGVCDAWKKCTVDAVVGETYPFLKEYSK